MTDYFTPGLPPAIRDIVQEDYLTRMFRDALFPALLYREEATKEEWEASTGETKFFTRRGLMKPNLTPLNGDPTPKSYAFEQWEATAKQQGDAIDTNLKNSYVALQNLTEANTTTLGLNAGQTVNRLARNTLFRAYLGGNTNLTVAASIGDTTVQVASINGFSVFLSNTDISKTRPEAVSPSNPLAVTVGGEEVNVIGATPANPANPFGPGTLRLESALTANHLIRESVFAFNRPFQLFEGASDNVDGILPGNTLTYQTIVNAVQTLRQNNVMPCESGKYHIHLTPIAVGQIQADVQFQRMYQSLPESAPHRDLIMADTANSRFYDNNESPNEFTVDPDSIEATGTNARMSNEIGADVVNEGGVPIQRAIVMGRSAIQEYWIDEMDFISEAGVQGKITPNVRVTNNGVLVSTDQVRLILRSPQDRLMQLMSMAWSWSGDWVCPTDVKVGNPAAYKRAVVINHA